MPWSLKRYNQTGCLHFITCSCYQRRPLLGTPEGRDLFLDVLEDMRLRYFFVAVGYVMMPEHFHLLMAEPEIGNPSVVMQALKLGFACRVLNGSQKSPTSRAQNAREMGHPKGNITSG